jgi:uncharacterized membrane protein
MISFFTPFRLFLLGAVGVTVGVGLAVVPPGTSLPVHWNMAGEPDAFLPRELALLMPAAIVFLAWAIFIFVDRRMTPEQREAGASMVGVAVTALTATFLFIGIATVAIGAGLEVSMVQVVAIALSLMLLVLGNAMPKSRPNGYAGIRLPTTLQSESNWLATHRLGGVLTIVGGIALLVAAFLAPANVLLWWIIGCVIGPMLVATVYSLWLAQRSS